jgi:hypothetical protein
MWSKGSTVTGYLAAVTAASASLVLGMAAMILYANGRGLPSGIVAPSLLLLAAGFIFAWLVIAAAAAMPFALTFRIARRLKTHSSLFYAVSGALTGAILAPILLMIGAAIPEEGGEAMTGLLSRYLHVAPLVVISGVVGGLAFWGIAGRGGRNFTARDFPSKLA